MSRHVALVTGGNRGIGAAIARRLAGEGATVLVAGRDTAACAGVVATIEAEGGEARTLALDVTEPASIQVAAKERVDWLVNNAGIAESAPLLQGGDELFRRHLEVNFHGARRLTEAFVPAMKERGYGRVVNVASSAGLRGYAYVAAYCASKFALVGYTLAAADELAGSGVTVNAVCPYYVDSPMLDHSIENLREKTGKSAEELRALFAEQNPGGRILTPDEVADAVATLLTGEANATLVELDGAGTRVLTPNAGGAR